MLKIKGYRLPLRQEKGVTLIELMLVIAILGIIFSVGSNVLMSGWRFMLLTKARWEIQRDVRTNLDLIHRYLRQAKHSSVTVYKSTTTYGVTNPPCSKISFTTVDDDIISYYQDGNKLYQKVKQSDETTYQTNQLAENLRYIYFAYPRSDERSIISLSICFEKSTYGGGAKALQLSVEKIRLMNE